MLYLKQSTASQSVLLGVFVDDTDGKTAETGLTIANTDIRLSANGGNMFAKTSGGGTHDENGWYTITLDATDTATVGSLQVSCKVAGALAVWMEFQVIEEAIYDALFAASAAAFDANQRVDVGLWLGTAAATPTVAGVPEIDMTHLGGVAQSATDLKDFADAGYDPATNKVQGVVLVDTVTTYTGNTVQTGDSFARIGAAGASLSDLGGMSTGMKAEVESEVNDALVVLKLDHLVAMADADDPVDDSIMAKIASTTGDWSLFVDTTDALQAIRDRGDSAWTTGAGGSDRLLMVDTTIATLSSQTSFTLTAGSADNDAYNNCTIVIEDVSTSTQKAVGLISAYVGSTKTVTLKYDPGIFTMATTDKVYILAENSLKSTNQNRQLDVTATGAAGIDWGNVENPTTALDLSGTDIQLCDTVTVNTDMVGTDSALLAASAPTNFGDMAITVTTGRLDISLIEGVDATDQINAACDTAITDAALATAANLATVDGNVDLILLDTGELQTDWVNGGRLDLILDAILIDTSATLDGKIDTIDSNIDAILVDTETTLPATLSTIAGYIDTEIATLITDVAAILVDTGTTLDGKLNTIDANVDLILADTGTDGVVITAATANAIADALLDRTDGIEPASAGTERTPREALRLILAACAGILSGAATNTVSIRDTNDSKDRIVATVDSDGNRSAVTLVDT